MSDDAKKHTVSSLIGELVTALMKHGDIPVTISEWGGAQEIPVKSLVLMDENNSDKHIYICG